MSWLASILFALAGFVSGSMEVWIAAQGTPSGGTWPSALYALLPVVAVGSLVLMAGGLASLPVRAPWSVGIAAALPLSLQVLTRAGSLLFPVAAVLAGALTWMFSAFRERLPSVLLANSLLLFWWLGLALEHARAFWPRTAEDAAGRPFATVVWLVASLLLGSLVAADFRISRTRKLSKRS
jgi:hypothetical protein